MAIFYGVRFPADSRDYYLSHIIQSASGVYPTFYEINNGVSFFGGKAAGA
jgi:hypothetical protein